MSEAIQVQETKLAWFTDDEARAIRRVKGWYPSDELAEAFGVSRLTIRRIWDEDTYKLGGAC